MEHKVNETIRLEGIHVEYPLASGGVKRVLNEVNLRVGQGEFVTVVGPTGCGKSTLLKLILGSQTPTRGTATFEGEAIGDSNRDRGIVFQKYSLFPHLSVIDNIAFGPELEEFNLTQRFLKTPAFREGRKKFRENAKQILEEVGLNPSDEDKYPDQLSGGMRQRVAIAQSLVMRPKVLLMDEPFGALDHATREAMQEMILQWSERHEMTIFFVTHDIEEALFLGSRILVLSQYYEGADGAKIVIDRDVPGDHPRTAEIKYEPDFVSLLSQIRRDGLDRTHRQPLHEFDISHPNGWHPTEGWLS